VRDACVESPLWVPLKNTSRTFSINPSERCEFWSSREETNKEERNEEEEKKKGRKEPARFAANS
jgi:hypothetical protein